MAEAAFLTEVSIRGFNLPCGIIFLFSSTLIADIQHPAHPVVHCCAEKTCRVKLPGAGRSLFSYLRSMENFVVSARKYRPATFATVVGQQHITTTLKNAIANNHLAHAFLFCGPRGVGKTTCARILAKTINCSNLGPDTEACNVCDNCLAFNNNASFNVHELDAASNNSVEDIRSLVEQVRYAPQSGKYKIYIIDEVHMLSNTAFNAFLKTLEEPPSYAIFILATTEKHKIIPTILSRCQIFDFNRIQIRDIAGHLNHIAEKEGIHAETEALNLIARKADGGLRDALSIFDLLSTFGEGRNITYKSAVENLHILDYDYYFRLTDAMLEENLGQALVIYDEILRRGFDGQNFISGMCEHLRNLMVCKDAVTLSLLEVSEAVAQKYGAQAAACSVSFLLSALNIAASADAQYKASNNRRLLIELALMKMCHILSAFRPQAGHIPRRGEAGQIPAKKPDAGSNAGHSASVASTAADSTHVAAIGVAGSVPAKPVPTDSENPANTLNVLAGNGSTSAIAGYENLKAATPQQRKPLADPAVAGIKSTVNLNALISGKSVSPEVIRPQQAEIARAEVPLLLTKFTLQALNIAWAELMDELRNQGDYNGLTALAEKELNFNDDFLITVTVGSALQAEQLIRLRDWLTDGLRNRLKNQVLQLAHEVGAAASGQPILYTSQDKFEHLMLKLPILAELKSRLRLEVES